MRRPLFYGVFVLAALVGAACSDSNPTTPTTPTPTATTETFDGTLTVNGALTFPFVATTGGSANATLTTMAPSLTINTQDGGSGSFITGETVFQGANVDDATITGVVYSWEPAAHRLSLKDVAGAFAADAAVVGVDSGAQWTVGSTGTPVVGLALGTWSGTTCSIVLSNDISGAGSVVTGVVQTAGSLCARVYDVGRIAGPTTFTLSVTHF
jgi:hypothetical protein